MTAKRTAPKRSALVEVLNPSGPTCDDCGERLIEQYMPTEMIWSGAASGWVPGRGEVFLVHRFGSTSPCLTRSES